jgi:DNA adenine methylase
MTVRPFLKWAGGKRQILPHIRPLVPPVFGRYVEPFVGSGAVYFDLYARGLLDSRPAILADTNVDLIGAYAAIAHHVEAVIEALETLAAGHATGEDAHYYQVRDRQFNPQRRKRHLRERSGRARYPPSLAAMFLYLNRTGFNGLYRLNSKGDFNVPAGRYANPQICDAANLRAVAKAIGRPEVDLQHAAFEATLARCERGDFVYIDPPYAPLSATASFTAYTASGFSDVDQRRLQQQIIRLSHRGCYVVLSNSTAPIITELYEHDAAATRAGLRAYRIPARRAINSDPSRRGPVDEYVITNVPPIE